MNQALNLDAKLINYLITKFTYMQGNACTLILETKIDWSHHGSQNFYVGEYMHLDTGDEDFPCQTRGHNVGQ